MEAPTPRSLWTLALSIALLAPLAPLAAPTASAQVEAQAGDCVLDRPQDIPNGYLWVDTITAPKFVLNQLPVTTQAYRLLLNEDESTRDTAATVTNGLDAYIIDLGCEVDTTSYCLTGDDNGARAYDLEVTFRDELFNTLEGPVNPDSSIDACGSDGDTPQSVPTGTQYVEIVTRDGVPGAAGLGDNLLPASVEFGFELRV